MEQLNRFNIDLEQYAKDFLEFLLVAGPRILLTLLMFMALNVLFKFLLQAFEHVAVKRFAAVDIEEEAHHKEELQKRIKTLMSVIRKTIYVALWSVAVMIVLSQLGINIGPLVATAGVLGLAVSFGAQNLIKDFISGLFMILENQVRLGDVAIINGTGGLVEKIELRTVTLRDFSGVVHIIQNGKIDTLSNMTKEWSAMVFDIGVAYKENTDTVMEVIREVGNQLREDEVYGPKIIEPIEVFGVDKFGDSAVVIRARIKTRPIEQWNVGREFRRRLKYAFDERNIEIPFPHTTVYWGEKISPLQLDLQRGD